MNQLKGFHGSQPRWSQTNQAAHKRHPRATGIRNISHVSQAGIPGNSAGDLFKRDGEKVTFSEV